MTEIATRIDRDRSEHDRDRCPRLPSPSAWIALGYNDAMHTYPLSALTTEQRRAITRIVTLMHPDDNGCGSIGMGAFGSRLVLDTPTKKSVVMGIETPALNWFERGDLDVSPNS